MNECEMAGIEGICWYIQLGGLFKALRYLICDKCGVEIGLIVLCAGEGVLQYRPRLWKSDNQNQKYGQGVRVNIIAIHNIAIPVQEIIVKADKTQTL